MHPEPQTPDLNSKPSTLNPEPEPLNLQVQNDLNPNPSNRRSNPQPKLLNPQVQDVSSTAGQLCLSLAACGDTLGARMTSLEGSLTETVALARKAEGMDEVGQSVSELVAAVKGLQVPFPRR